MTRDFEALRGQDVIVTGGTGFLGSAFVRAAAKAGARLTLLSRAGADRWRLSEIAGEYSLITTSLEGLSALRVEIPAGAVMVHFAAAGVNQASDDLADMVATNIAGTAAALAFAVRAGVSRFVLLGSSGEYGPGVRLSEDSPLRPTSEYGATRASATLLARAFGARRTLDVVVVRPFAVYGPYEAAYRLIPNVTIGALRREPVSLSSGRQTRDYVHVDDVAEGIARAATLDAARNEVFNLCTGVETSVLEAARRVEALVGTGEHITVGALPPIPGEMWRTSGDPSRAREVLGWVPRTDFSTGLRHTVEWFRSIGMELPAYRAHAS